MAYKSQKQHFVQCSVVNVQHNSQKLAYLKEKSLAPFCCILAESRQLLSFPGEVKSAAHTCDAVRKGELTRLTGSSQLKKEIA
jgi:hypothetical protein